MSIANILSESLLELQFPELPDGVIRFARIAFLDWMGSALAGSDEESVRILLQVLPSCSPDGEATLLALPGRCQALFAALVNGTASHGKEMDDFHRTSMVHLGVTVIPGLLALAEKVGASGEEFVTSLVAGFEAGIRIGEAVNPSHWEFWHPTGTCGTFASAAACGRLLKLTRQQMSFALGIAGTQSAGFRFYEGMNKHLHAGKAAMNGMLSALLAQKGFTGDEHIFEGETGFCKAMAKEYDLQKITAGLPLTRGTFRCLENSYKPYASCRHTHPAVDAVLAIVRTHSIRADDIESIDCRTYSAATRLLKDPTVKDAMSAKFSLPFCIATAATMQKLSLDAFSHRGLWNEDVRNLMQRVRVETDPAFDEAYPTRWPAEVNIVTKSGQSIKHRVDYPKGEPENPMSPEEIVGKFREISSPVIGESRTDALVQKVMKLDSISDMKRFFEDLFDDKR